MRFAIVAAAAYLTSLFFQWRGGFISFAPWHASAAATGGRNIDRHSSVVWNVANALEFVGLVLGAFGVTRIEAHRGLIGMGGLMLLIAGTGIRWAAIRTLGRFFTGVVKIQPGHQLVRQGPYRIVRHPAYVGTLVAHLGLGMAFVSWISIALSTLPLLTAALYRIHVEENCLRQQFGPEWSTYAEATWCLIPWVY